MNRESFQKSLPADLAQIVFDYQWQEIHVGFSAAQIFRLAAENKKSLYLKVLKRSFGNLLLPEKQKLDWLKNKLPVPKVLFFAQDQTTDYLLLSEIEGADASRNSFEENKRGVIELLAAGLKTIHSLSPADCPFDARLDYKIQLARKMMENNLVDESDFNDERRGRTARDLFRELVESVPEGADPVFTHGDYCLPNIILKNGKLSGFVDWGSAGVADKYQDIALLARSVEYNFGAKWKNVLFEILEIEPDEQKLHFYTLLDEFF